MVGGVVAGHAHVVLLARLQDAGAELVEAGIILGGLHLVDKLAGVEGDYVVLAELEDVHVQRDIAIGNVESEVDQARLCFLKGELEPLEAFDHGRVAVFAARGRVGAFVVAAINGLAELEGLGGLPGAVGRRGDDSRGKAALGRQRWSFEDLAQRSVDLRRRRSRGEAHGDGAGGTRAEGQVEIKVGGMQPFGVDHALRVFHRGQDGVAPLHLRGIFHRQGKGIESAGARRA